MIRKFGPISQFGDFRSIQTDKQINRHTQTDRQTETNTQTDRQTDTVTDRRK